jgi:predicted nucleic acid-binding Zn ribbon protein
MIAPVGQAQQPAAPQVVPQAQPAVPPAEMPVEGAGKPPKIGRPPKVGKAMDVCPYCGSPIRPNVKFCASCGKPLPQVKKGGRESARRPWLVWILLVLLILLVGVVAFMAWKIFGSPGQPVDAQATPTSTATVLPAATNTALAPVPPMDTAVAEVVQPTNTVAIIPVTPTATLTPTVVVQPTASLTPTINPSPTLEPTAPPVSQGPVTILKGDFSNTNDTNQWIPSGAPPAIDIDTQTMELLGTTPADVVTFTQPVEIQNKLEISFSVFKVDSESLAFRWDAVSKGPIKPLEDAPFRMIFSSTNIGVELLMSPGSSRSCSLAWPAMPSKQDPIPVLLKVIEKDHLKIFLNNKEVTTCKDPLSLPVFTNNGKARIGQISFSGSGRIKDLLVVQQP